MTVEKSPAFQFYPKDFLTDEAVQLMSHQERGVYITLLCHCWLEGSLPPELSTLARLVGLPLAHYRRLWAGPIGRCFRAGTGGRLFNRRLELERQKQQDYRVMKSAIGKLAAARRWHGPNGHANHANAMPTHSQGNAKALPKHASSSSSSTPVKKSATAKVSRAQLVGGAACPHVPRCETTKICIERTIADGRKVGT